MSTKRNRFRTSSSPISGGVEGVRVLPSLATAEQIAQVLQVSSRTVHMWASAQTIPTALRCGKVVRFSPSAVAAALSLDVPEFRNATEGESHNHTGNP